MAAKCQQVAARGADASLIEEQDFSPVLRAKEDAATAEQVASQAAAMLATLDALAPAGLRPENGSPS